MKISKKHIGEMVMSKDAGCKMIESVTKPHGPYKLLQITKAGFAVLEGRRRYYIRCCQLSLATATKEAQL